MAVLRIIRIVLYFVLYLYYVLSDLLHSEYLVHSIRQNVVMLPEMIDVPPKLASRAPIFDYFRSERCLVRSFTPLQACGGFWPRLVDRHARFGFAHTHMHLSICADRAMVTVVLERRRLKDHPTRLCVGGRLGNRC